MSLIHAERTPLFIKLSVHGQVDSSNATEFEQEIKEAIKDVSKESIVIDMEDLDYISSAGLRVLLRVRKAHDDLKIINVSPEVYEIFDMTGFTQMMDIQKAYRVVSVEGCEVIGTGANGTIYRIDQDNVVKVYNNADALDEIQNERELARLALVLGVPTAISYDVVRVGDSYGSVFELLNAQSFSKILSTQPEKLDWCVTEYVKLLQKIHSTVVPEHKLPDIKEVYIDYVKFLEDYLPKEKFEKLFSMVNKLPEDNHMIHGDYHTKNVEKTDDEVLLIDMDTLAHGHPVFELASMFNAFVGFSEFDHNVIKEFQGFDFELSNQFWNKSLHMYLGTSDEDKVREVTDKARILGYTRLIRRSIRRDGLNQEKTKAEIDGWTNNLLQLLDTYDSLYF